jgi:Zn-dependent peptidase ImmA (M78 family)
VTPLRPRYARIDKMIDHLLSEHNVKEPPIPIEKMIRAEGVTVRKINLKDISGMIVRDKDSVLIGVNSTQAETRQRFTLAHEFGHFMLHEGKPVHYDKQFRMDLRSSLSATGTDTEEVEANYFGSALLMPRIFLERDVADRFIDIEDADAVDDLAKRYKVSLQAMNIRLLNVFGQAS